MPAFQTPAPITLRVDFASGDLDITAAPRTDTVVEVRPANPSRSIDVEYAEETRVEHAGGTVSVEAPRRFLSLGRTPRLKIVVGLPEGSRVDFTTASADARMTGPLGEVSADTASGDVRIDHCAGLAVKTASGDVICDVTAGGAQVRTASGDVGLREVRDGASVTTSSGKADLGVVGGAATVKTASGAVRIRQAGDSLQVKSASADVTVDSVAHGGVWVNTASGDVVIGIPTGTSAWLDVSSISGRVGSSLEQSDQPTDDGAKAEIHVKTVSGDIAITRARP
ncbi:MULTISPECIES: DUF4097 family beta strand repeat-containing protein [Streptosporangium]|uniref:DUF4097 domain-containing protein n=1 Tax=Streptosporangium brasiliense TaxID=47480 RepID=A0ABT9R9J9_9ACTN|nr:DUF4097 family beta strand repeat-containing protein [Streptosporangium brasiliense]MDP9865923.1 hypothetical protein [Streptosporangium brasiliense]